MSGDGSQHDGTLVGPDPGGGTSGIVRAAVGIVLVALGGLVVERRRRRRAAGPNVAHTRNPLAVRDVADPDDVVARVDACHGELGAQLDHLRALPTGSVGLDEVARREGREVVAAASRLLAAEDAVLWPAVRRHLPEGDELSGREAEEVTELRRALQALDQRLPSDPTWAGALDDVAGRAGALRTHLRTRVLPPLSRQLDERARARLGRELAAARAAAPTRPHPGAPDPAAHPHLGRVVAAADRLGDRLGGRA